MNNMINSYNTRTQNDLHFGAVNTNLGKISLKFKDSNVWNCLQTSLKQPCSIYKFKKTIKIYLQSRIFDTV